MKENIFEDNLNINSIIEEEKNNSYTTKVGSNSKKSQKDFRNMILSIIEDESKEKEYTDQIKNNPSSLFETISESQIKQWEEKLISNKDSKLIRSNKPDDKIFSKINKIELKEKQVIKNDSIRTRSREGELIPDFKLTLYQTLTYYCFKAKANYKQGLN